VFGCESDSSVTFCCGLKLHRIHFVYCLKVCEA
jgi:hypothetical protein